MNKKHFLTTGQLAKLHHINKKTLMYYDEIGLFSPKIRADNNYRYYTFDQCNKLETILFLRELDFSIPEILSYMKTSTPEVVLELMSTQKEKVNNQIQKFLKLHAILEQKETYIQNAINSFRKGIFIEEVESEKLLISPYLESDSLADIYNFFEGTLSSLGEIHLYNYYYGSILTEEDWANCNYNNYSLFYIKPLNFTASLNSFLKPAGRYLTLYWRGSWETLPKAYNYIHEHCQKNHILITGYSYEENIIDDFCASSANDYVTKISIQIQNG